MSPALLSRVAESVFWIGRYLERAEGTARIIDVVVQGALEERALDSPDAARRLLAVMGLDPTGPGGEAPAIWEVTDRLAHDPDSRSSIAGALTAARDNARAVRHIMPVELWEQINATWVELPARWEQTRRAGPSGYLAFVRTRVAAVTGLADTTMSRDQTWTFFTLGRALERTDVVARQLASVSVDSLTESGLVSLLRSCGGYEPYLRLARGMVETDRVVDFLIRNPLFPRSAFASIVTAQACLEQICAEQREQWDEARGLIGLARAELEFSSPGALRAQLGATLQRLQARCSDASDAVTRRYFTVEAATSWRAGWS